MLNGLGVMLTSFVFRGSGLRRRVFCIQGLKMCRGRWVGVSRFSGEGGCVDISRACRV